MCFNTSKIHSRIKNALLQMEDNNRNKFILRALALAEEGMNTNCGGPFGAVVVKDGKIIGEGYNTVTSDNDPTAHAEVMAIRQACKAINSFQLKNCEIYCSCEPCPMCLGAIYWARIDKIYYAANREHAAKIGFDDEFIYKELPLDPSARKIQSIQLMENPGISTLKKWLDKKDKISY